MFETEDLRFRSFLLDQVGTSEDRRKVMDFQRLLLSRRQDLIPQVETYAQRNGYTFPLGADATLEFVVAEYLMEFWQYGDGDVSRIPPADAAAEVLFDSLNSFSGFSDYTQASISYYEAYVYQAYTEMGCAPLICDHLQDLLATAPAPSYRAIAPAGVAMNFDAGVMADLNSWLKANGNNIVYIYGANDPYVCAAFEPTGQTNALRVIQPGANHRVRIADLDERERVLHTLGEWLGISISSSAGLWEQAATVNREQAMERRLEER